MSHAKRWTAPTEQEINRLLTDTDSRRSELEIVLRNQKVSLPDQYRPPKFKNVKRNVHFVYYNPVRNRWTGQIHRNQTEWEPVEFNNHRAVWEVILPDGHGPSGRRGMSEKHRQIPTEREIKRLLIDTQTHRSELALVLWNQPVVFNPRWDVWEVIQQKFERR